MKKVFALSIIFFCLAPVLSLAQTVTSVAPDYTNNNSTVNFTQAGPNANCDFYDSRATCYQQLAPITDPGTGKDVNTLSFPTYLQGIYRIGIGACFVLGVIMFTWAGIEYIVSESMFGKSAAKSRITNALTGLAIALVSYILLYTINPDLLQFKSLDTTVKTTPVLNLTPAGPTK